MKIHKKVSFTTTIRKLKKAGFLTTVIIPGKPKKSKDEMHKELFLRKRKKQVGKAETNLLDFDFNLGTISESDSSGDEMFLVPANKDLAKSMRSKTHHVF